MKKTISLIILVSVLLGCNGVLYQSSKNTKQPVAGTIGVVYPNFKYLRIEEVSREEENRITQLLQEQIQTSLAKLSRDYKVEFVSLPFYFSSIEDFSVLQKEYGIDYLLDTQYTFLEYDNDLDSVLIPIITDFTVFPSEGKYKIELSLKELHSQEELWSFRMKGNASKVGVSNRMVHPRRELKKRIAYANEK